ncbi:MAG: autotransporter domain-containing protein [Devosia sp.]
MTYLSGELSSGASAVSYDGKIVVGNSRLSSTVIHAFRWIDGMGTDLGALTGGTYEVSQASDMSADGMIVVGVSYDAALKTHAVRWDENGKLRLISDLLSQGGVDISGWTLTDAMAISNDGMVIMGSGAISNAGGVWIAHCVDACKEADPVMAIITPQTAGESFSGLGALGATASTYLGTEIDTAGDMAAQGKNGGLTGYAYGAFDSDPTTSATVGVTYGIGPNVTIAGSLGIAGIRTLMPFNGSATFFGPAATLALASRPSSGFDWLLGGALVGVNGTVARGYLNGNTPVTSSGSTFGDGAGFTAQAGWTFDDLVADTLVTPFVNVSLSSMSFAGYTETGGPFPATFSAFTTSSTLVTFGVEARREFRKDSWVSASIGYSHNLGNGGTIAGTLVGIPLAVPGAAPIADFVEASIGLDMPINETINFTGRLAAIIPFGGTPSVQARAGVTMAF